MPQEADLDDEQIRALLHHGICRSEKQVRNDHKFKFISKSELHRHRETCGIDPVTVAKSLMMEIEITCLLKRDLNKWIRNTKWRLSTIVILSFSNKLMLNDWIWRTPITDVLNLEENKFDYKKKFSELLKIRNMHEMGEIKRAREQRKDEVSVQKLGENHETIQQLTSQLQHTQEQIKLCEWFWRFSRCGIR